ncbi:MAG: hypothetical protein Q7U75_19360, partial [Desulfobacterales bacterium]|nr:hypothetical protein [Desulfobacterales bacterium]
DAEAARAALLAVHDRGVDAGTAANRRSVIASLKAMPTRGYRRCVKPEAGLKPGKVGVEAWSGLSEAEIAAVLKGLGAAASGLSWRVRSGLMRVADEVLRRFTTSETAVIGENDLVAKLAINRKAVSNCLSLLSSGDTAIMTPVFLRSGRLYEAGVLARRYRICRSALARLSTPATHAAGSSAPGKQSPPLLSLIPLSDGDAGSANTIQYEVTPNLTYLTLDGQALQAGVEERMDAGTLHVALHLEPCASSTDAWSLERAVRGRYEGRPGTIVVWFDDKTFMHFGEMQIKLPRAARRILDAWD